MAFDVYVGTMSRFYRREWENVVQREARERGTDYRMIYAGGDPEPPPAADDIREAVTAWCQMLSNGLSAHEVEPIHWSEAETQPYFTDRPGWEGYTALLLWAAYAEHPDLTPPTDLPESWADDAAFQRCAAENFRSRYQQILKPELWLPAPFPFIFDAPTIVSESPSSIGSTFTLQQHLNELYATTQPRLTSVEDGNQAMRLANAATIGIAIFRELVNQACHHRLPILLHF